MKIKNNILFTVHYKKVVKKTLFNLITNFMLKKGKKDLAKKVLKIALIKASKKINLGSQLILAIVFKKLRASVEVKDVKRRRNYLKIPFFIRLKRQRYLSIK